MNEYSKHIRRNLPFFKTVAFQTTLILSVSFLILASEHVIRIGAYELSIHNNLIQHFYI